MAFINFPAREIHCKIVYCGPGLCGKTTNVTYLHKHTHEEARGRLVSLATESERTLFFDFMPLSLGLIRGMRVRLHLYTVPGQVFYKAARQLILKGCDGVIFVADSQPERMDANLMSLEDLQESLAAQKKDFITMPLIMQYNKRDLPHAMPINEMQALLNPNGIPSIEACAQQGIGVLESLKEAARLALRSLKQNA